MTVETRFAYLSADFVVTSQDLVELKQMAAEMNTRLGEQAERLDEAHACIVALMACAETKVGLDPNISERARKWLEEA